MGKEKIAEENSTLVKNVILCSDLLGKMNETTWNTLLLKQQEKFQNINEIVAKKLQQSLLCIPIRIPVYKNKNKKITLFLCQ